METKDLKDVYEEALNNVAEWEMYEAIDHAVIGEDTTLTVLYEAKDNKVMFHTEQVTEDGVYEGNNVFSKDEFLSMTEDDFEKAVNETVYYSAVVDRGEEAEQDAAIEEFTMDDVFSNLLENLSRTQDVLEIVKDDVNEEHKGVIEELQDDIRSNLDQYREKADEYKNEYSRRAEKLLDSLISDDENFRNYGIIGVQIEEELSHLKDLTEYIYSEYVMGDKGIDWRDDQAQADFKTMTKEEFLSAHSEYTAENYRAEMISLAADITALNTEDSYASFQKKLSEMAEYGVPSAIDPLVITEEYVCEWAKEQLKDITYGDMSLTISPSRYDDYVRSDTLLKAYNEYVEIAKDGDTEYGSFRNYLEDKLDEMLWERQSEEIHDLVGEIAARVLKESPRFQEAFEKFTEDLEIDTDRLESWGFEGVSIDVEAFLNNDYRINLMMATEQEKNYDMSSIGSTYLPLDDIGDSLLNSGEEFEKATDNALTYLIRQQGYTVGDVYNSYYGKDNPDSAFVESVVAELTENYNHGLSELTFLVSASGGDVIELLDKLAKGEGNIALSKDVTAGLFNEWDGSGSILEIALKQEAIFPVDMVRNVQFESSGKWDCVSKDANNGYTVDDVYGLIHSAWERNSVSVTDKEPVLREENMKSTQETLKKYVEAEKADKTKSSPEHIGKD